MADPGPTPPGPGRDPGPDPQPPPGAVREAGCVAGAGVVALPVLVWGFSARLGLDFSHALYLGALLGLLPALAVAQVPLAQDAPVERLGAYAGSTAMLAILGSAAVFLGWDEPGPAAMGLGLPDAGTFWAWTGGLLLVAAALQALFHYGGRALGIEETDLLKRLLPRTREEKQAFVAVSVVAGFGEEIAFRGFAIPVLAPVLGGVWPTVAFTSVVFGLLHAYQGAVGIVRTAVFGAVLAAAFVLSGSLWPAVAVHLVVDVAVGLWLGERMV